MTKFLLKFFQVNIIFRAKYRPLMVKEAQLVVALNTQLLQVKMSVFLEKID